MTYVPFCTSRRLFCGVLRFQPSQVEISLQRICDFAELNFDADQAVFSECSGPQWNEQHQQACAAVGATIASAKTSKLRRTSPLSRSLVRLKKEARAGCTGLTLLDTN